MNKWILGIIAVLSIVGLFFLTPLQPTIAASTYYISYSTGNDSTGDGSIGTPWKTWDGADLDVTDALSAGDVVRFMRGDTWTGNDAEVYIDSSGTAANPIVIEAYGAGADPILQCSTLTAANTWSLDSGSIYVYDNSITWWPNWVFESDTSTPLIAKGSKGDMSAGTSYYDGTNDLIYVWTSDSADPDTHTMYIPNDNAQGVVSVWNTSDYVTMKNIEVQHSKNDAFAVRGDYFVGESLTARWAAGAGIYLFHNMPTYGADYAQIQNCYVTRTNIYTSQAYTIEGSNNWIYDSVAENNYMAGFDFLDYSEYTVVENSGLVRCIAKNNGLRPGTYDANIYIDGASYIWIIDCISDTPAPDETSTWHNGIRIEDEHPDEGDDPHHIYIIGNLVYGQRDSAFAIGSDSYGSDFDYIYVYGNTFKRGDITNAFRTVMIQNIDNATYGVDFRNNIVDGGGSALIRWGRYELKSNFHADYNLYYRDTPSQYLFEVDSDNDENTAHVYMTLSEWKDWSGEDANSVELDPDFADDSDDYGAYHLSHIASGQATDSGALDVGDDTYRSSGRRGLPLGTTRTDKTVDDAGDVDIGYHYPSSSTVIIGGVSIRGLNFE